MILVQMNASMFALLFDNIPDYPQGFRVATNTGLSYLQTALQLRLPLEGSGDTPRGLELLLQWREKLLTYKPVPPVEVKEGPIMENVDQGDDVNLWKFPAPRWHEKDGGRYLGTGCVNITSDPDNGDVNMGVYRCMIHTENTIGVPSPEIPLGVRESNGVVLSIWTSGYPIFDRKGTPRKGRPKSQFNTPGSIHRKAPSQALTAQCDAVIFSRYPKPSSGYKRITLDNVRRDLW